MLTVIQQINKRLIILFSLGHAEMTKLAWSPWSPLGHAEMTKPERCNSKGFAVSFTWSSMFLNDQAKSPYSCTSSLGHFPIYKYIYMAPKSQLYIISFLGAK